MSEPRVNSPETKRLMEVAVANGAFIRTAYKAVRKRLRIEARRQKELDDGVEPEVVLDSFLNQVVLEQHPQSGPLKRVLTPAAKAAKHRVCEGQEVARDSVLVVANVKVCPDGDRCNFKRAVTVEKEQTVSGTGVLSPGPSLRQKHPKGSTCDSWNDSWDRYDYREKWTDEKRPTSSVHLLLDSTWIPTQRWGNCACRRGSVAKTCSAVPASRHPSMVADRAGLVATSRIAQTVCTHLPQLLVHRANQWASMDVCDKKRGGCGAIMN